MRNLSQVLLNAVVANTDSPAYDTSQLDTFSFYVKPSGVTTGATVAISVLTPANDWVDIDVRVVNNNNSYIVTFSGAFRQIRASVRTRTDGTYTVSVQAKKIAP